MEKKKGRKKSKERKNTRKKRNQATSCLGSRNYRAILCYYKRSGRLTANYNIYESSSIYFITHKQTDGRTSHFRRAGSNKGSNETITFPIPKIGSTAIRVQDPTQPTNQRSSSPLYSGYSADEVLLALTHSLTQLTPQTGNTGRTILVWKCVV